MSILLAFSYIYVSLLRNFFQDSVEFINPELIVHDKFVEIATDFNLGEWKLREKVKEAFATSFPKMNT